MQYPIIFAFLLGVVIFAIGKISNIQEIKQLGGGFVIFVGVLIFLSLTERYLFK